MSHQPAKLDVYDGQFFCSVNVIQLDEGTVREIDEHEGGDSPPPQINIHFCHVAMFVAGPPYYDTLVSIHQERPDLYRHKTQQLAKGEVPEKLSSSSSNSGRRRKTTTWQGFSQQQGGKRPGARKAVYDTRPLGKNLLEPGGPKRTCGHDFFEDIKAKVARSSRLRYVLMRALLSLAPPHCVSYLSEVRNPIF